MKTIIEITDYITDIKYTYDAYVYEDEKNYKLVIKGSDDFGFSEKEYILNLSKPISRLNVELKDDIDNENEIRCECINEASMSIILVDAIFFDLLIELKKYLEGRDVQQ